MVLNGGELAFNNPGYAASQTDTQTIASDSTLPEKDKYDLGDDLATSEAETEFTNPIYDMQNEANATRDFGVARQPDLTRELAGNLA